MQLLLVLTLCVFSGTLLASPINDRWLKKESIDCINGISLVKYDYDYADLSNTTLNIAIDGEIVRTLKGRSVFDHWHRTEDDIKFIHFKYGGKAYTIYIQDSKGEGIMLYDYTSPAIDCAVMTGTSR